MSRRLKKLCLGGALAVTAMAGITSSASAAITSWHTNGNATGTTITATAGASRLDVTATGSAIGVQGITCATSSVHGLLFGPTFLSATANVASSVTPIFGGPCLVVGQTAAVQCRSTGVLNAQNFASPITSGQLSGIDCVIVKTSGACGNATTFTGGGITVTGTVQGTYNNSTRQLTVSQSGQNLHASWSATGCLQGTGTGSATGSFANASGTDLTYTITGSHHPTIVATF
jgi:hypothetical protein